MVSSPSSCRGAVLPSMWISSMRSEPLSLAIAALVSGFASEFPLNCLSRWTTHMALSGLVNAVVDSRGDFFVHECLLQCHSVKNSSMQSKRASCILSAAYIKQVFRVVSSVWYAIGSIMVITWAIMSQLKQHQPCCMTAGIVTIRQFAMLHFTSFSMSCLCIDMILVVFSPAKA